MVLLECRLEQVQAALATAREEADHVRTKLAETALRETEHTRRFCLIHEELADARAELAMLHRHLERSEALRAELAGHLFEAGPGDDTEELMRLRRRALVEDERALANERTIARLRERVEALVSSRETLLTRIAEWQKLVREDGPEAADLSEFLAELRREILDLERRSANSNAREAELREQLVLAGIDPDGRTDEDVEDDVQGGVEDEGQGVEADDASVAEIVSEDADASVADDAPEAADGAGQEDLSGEEDASGEDGTALEAPVEEEADDSSAEEEPAREASATEESEAGPAAVATPPEIGPDTDAVETLAVAAPESGDEADSPADDTHVPPPPTPARGPTDTLVSELLAAQLPELRADLLLRLGRTGDEGAVETVRSWTKSPEPSVRAAAYEALGRLLEREPDQLEPLVRAGIADEDARVRRRVVLAAATARGLETQALLGPLRDDPDAQVRRLIRQVLRPTPATDRPAETQRSLRA